MENIPAVANSPPQINFAEFVKLTIYNDYNDPTDTTIVTASSSYKDETIGGVTYSALGGLLAVGNQQKNLRVTSADTTIALSGISGTAINTVLDNNIRGSLLEISRGFYNNSDVLDVANVAPRFTGIITSYNIDEDRQQKTNNFSVTVNASSYKTVLENRLAGRRTNRESWQSFNSTDSSMNNIYSIATQLFDFGKPVNSRGTGGGGGGGSESIGGDFNANKNQRK
jgi:hypothetical protein